MATIAPMALWKPFDGKSTTALTHDIICAHTMVGTLAGSWSWANQSGNPYWHFGLAGNGTLWQCQELEYRSAANLYGNWRVIPIETADMKEGIFPDTWQDPPWTQAQLDKLVELIAWLCVRYNIPPVLIPDTKPGRRGLAYHRQGIEPWLVDGGEKWSNANGKTCPAGRTSQFINIVVPRVQALVNGEDMPTAAELADAIWAYPIANLTAPAGTTSQASAFLRYINSYAGKNKAAVAAAQAAVDQLDAGAQVIDYAAVQAAAAQALKDVLHTV